MLYAPEAQRVKVRAGQMNTQGGAEGSAYHTKRPHTQTA